MGEDSNKPNKCQGMRLTFISLNIVVFLVVFVVLVDKIVIFYFVYRTE